MSVRDRIYGALELPPLAAELADSCPVLQRLREVRMANIPFASFPSFANVTRFEHSLGVAHLAWRFARAQELPKEEALALTLAGLYHDGASPAFGHLYEEFLIADGFDHERALVELLVGSDALAGGADAQVFLGRRCRLKDKVPAIEPGSVLSSFGVADILAGRHALSSVIAGSIDLDNIDNVIRAASAMGLPSAGIVHPYEILDSLTLQDGALALSGSPSDAIARWQTVRAELYRAILANTFEFRCQSATKWAIALAAESEPLLAKRASWTLTEPELVFEHLRHHPRSRELIDGVRLGSPPPQLLKIEVKDITPILNPPGLRRIAKTAHEIGELMQKPAYINFYIDKGPRPIALPRAGASPGAPSGQESPHAVAPPAGVLGVFLLAGTGSDARHRHGPERAGRGQLSAQLAARLGLELTASAPAHEAERESAQLPIFA